jgi:hypothetical protein
MSKMKTITEDVFKKANKGEYIKPLGMGGLGVPTGGLMGKTRYKMGEMMIGKGGQKGLTSVANDITPEGIATAAGGGMKATPIKILSKTHKKMKGGRKISAPQLKSYFFPANFFAFTSSKISALV